MTDKNLFIGGAIEKYGEENLKGRLEIEGNVIGCMIQDLSLVSNANQKHFITRDGNEIFKVLKKIYDDDISVLSEVDYMRYANEDGISYKDIKNLGDIINLNNKDAYFKKFNESNTKIFGTPNEKHILNFYKQIQQNKDKPKLTTGFSNLDNMLDGGLREGLYAIGAMSSIGKTTFSLQIADYLARNNHHVLYYSLEQSSFEMKCKSISRITYETTHKIEESMTSTNIGEGNCISELQQVAMDNAIRNYFDEINPYMHIINGNRPTLEDIEKKVKDFEEEYLESPVVFIDYLQILKFDGDKTDKQNIDEAITELKSLSVKHHIPVVVISSLNRNSYREKISMEAFKESGGIEYGCDKIFGLQFVGQGSNGFDVNMAKSLDTRDIELIVLKNRTGRTGESLYFKYKPMFNCYKENWGGFLWRDIIPIHVRGCVCLLF